MSESVIITFNMCIFELLDYQSSDIIIVVMFSMASAPEYACKCALFQGNTFSMCTCLATRVIT